MPLPTGLTISSLNHLAMSSPIFIIVFLNGSVICLRIAPAIPPRLIPSLPLAPNIIFLKVSVVDTRPIPAPNTAFPRRPKGPKKKVPSIAAPIFGNAFLIAAFLSLFKRPVLSPKKKSLTLLLFLMIDAPAPIIAPPRGPNGVINPPIAPVIPYFFISGAYFSKISITRLETRPPVRLSFPSLSLTTSPNMYFWNFSLLESV